MENLLRSQKKLKDQESLFKVLLKYCKLEELLVLSLDTDMAGACEIEEKRNKIHERMLKKVRKYKNDYAN